MLTHAPDDSFRGRVVVPQIKLFETRLLNVGVGGLRIGLDGFAGFGRDQVAPEFSGGVDATLIMALN